MKTENSRHEAQTFQRLPVQVQEHAVRRLRCRSRRQCQKATWPATTTDALCSSLPDTQCPRYYVLTALEECLRMQAATASGIGSVVSCLANFQAGGPSNSTRRIAFIRRLQCTSQSLTNSIESARAIVNNECPQHQECRQKSPGSRQNVKER